MWKQKIGLSISNHYSIPIGEVVALLKQIGFDAISPVWASNDALVEIINAANQWDMCIQSLHAPFARAADMWRHDRDLASAAKADIMHSLEACARFQIPTLVVHAWIGFDYTFHAEALNFTNFDEIVSFAAEHNIQIAFENTEGEEYLFALMQHFENNDTVGFCWDSGHEMCYNHSQDLLSKFGDHLIMTHLNDNLGIRRFDGVTHWTDDLHLLPFDGIADWDNIIARLRKSKQLPILNFELSIVSKPQRHENDIYAQMPLEQYFTEAYKRACKIAYRYSK